MSTFTLPTSLFPVASYPMSARAGGETRLDARIRGVGAVARDGEHHVRAVVAGGLDADVSDRAARGEERRSRRVRDVERVRDGAHAACVGRVRGRGRADGRAGELDGVACAVRAEAETVDLGPDPRISGRAAGEEQERDDAACEELLGLEESTLHDITESPSGRSRAPLRA